MPKKASTTPAKPRRKTTPIAETDAKWEKLNGVTSPRSTKTRSKEKPSIQEQQAIPTQIGNPAKFPYPSFPYRLHIKAENRTCWFECEEHLHKLIQRENLQPNQYEISTNGVALVEQSTGRKGTQKRPRSRQSSNT